MSTYFQTKEEGQSATKWLVVDASDYPVGRLAAEVAALIRGKHRPEFTKHIDGGDFVVVINAEKVLLSGNKLSGKEYRHHTGYIGGLKSISAETMLEKHPERIIESAVKGMLPKNALGRKMLKKLKVYVGKEHPHSAQMPEVYELRYAERRV